MRKKLLSRENSAEESKLALAMVATLEETVNTLRKERQQVRVLIIVLISLLSQ